MSDAPQHIAAELRRLSRKCEHFCNDPRAMMVQAAAVIEQMAEGLAAVTRERDAAVFAMKVATEERDAMKYAADRLSGELQSTDAEHEHSVRALADTYQALERVTRERDEARAEMNSHIDHLWGVISKKELERDALRAEVETLREQLRDSRTAHDDLIRRIQMDTGL